MSAEQGDATLPSSAGLRCIVPGLAELGPRLDRMDAYLEAHGVPAKLRRRALLATEEIVVNAIRHGREDASEPVSVEMLADGERIVSEISYAGVDFDPSDPASVLPIDPNRLGGDGLRLVHDLVETIRYSRMGERNTVTLVVALLIAAKP